MGYNYTNKSGTVGLNMRTQVGIIGAGPAGLFLAHILHRAGIESVILEGRSRQYVEDRVRAGVLESGTVDVMRELGLDGRLKKESMTDEGLDIRFSGNLIHMDFPELTGGKVVTIYGQQEVVKDLIAARLKDNGKIVFEAEALAIDNIDTKSPAIRYRANGKEETLECDFVAGCDGFHGISRPTIPKSVLTEYDRVYSFAWLGVLSHSPPIKDMTYSNNERGFALCSRRSPKVSRHYLQVPVDEDPDDWSDRRFWDELHLRLDDVSKEEIVEGEIFQKNVAPLRAFVAAPMQHGRLFLAGDASHIVPPTGAKGLNLAVADVRVLSRAMIEFYRTGSVTRLDRYSDVCLKRVWKTVRFSSFMTSLLHRFPEHSPFDRKIQLAELEYLHNSKAAQTTIVENYIGLPFEDD
jgi:p-hydroxybenzoate 3-monooxygenase